MYRTPADVCLVSRCTLGNLAWGFIRSFGVPVELEHHIKWFNEQCVMIPPCLPTRYEPPGAGIEDGVRCGGAGAGAGAGASPLPLAPLSTLLGGNLLHRRQGTDSFYHPLGLTTLDYSCSESDPANTD